MIQILRGVSRGDQPEPTATASEEARNPVLGTPGQRIFGDYELLEEIAQGGMGIVYKARQLSLNRLVAMKMVRSNCLADAKALRRFQTETRAAAQLRHPHIVAIHEVGTHAGQHFFTMDLVEGPNLGQMVRQYPLSSQKAAAYLKTIAEAIHYAHQRGVLHRDIKSSNVLIDSRDQPQVTDFGLAKLIHSDSELTFSGMVIGSPSFMAPEQARGQSSKVTVRTDVYSLGALLYELVTGRAPFKAESSLATLKLVTESDPVPPRELNPRIPRDIETICLKCMEKDPAKRYDTAQGLADELGRFLSHQPILARPVGILGRLGRFTRRNPTLAAALLACVFILVAGMMGVSWQWQRANRHAVRAETALAKSKEALWQANFDRAHALRTSRQMGQRVKALEAIRAAAAIRPTPALREEAIAAMALTDLEDVGPWHSQPANAARYAVDSRLEQFAWGLTDGVIEVRRFADGLRLGVLTNRLEIERLEFSASGELLLVFDQQGSRCWEWKTRRLLAEISNPRAAASRADVRWSAQATAPENAPVAISPDDRWLAYTQPPSNLVWRSLAGSPATGQWSVAKAPSQLCFSPDGTLLASQSDRDVEIWRLADQRRLSQLKLPSQSRGMSWSPDQMALAVGCEDYTVRVWNLAANLTVPLTPLRASGVKPFFHPAGGLLASIAWDDTLRLWDPAGTLLMETRFARPLGFSADGQWLAVHNARGLGRLRVHGASECRPLRAPLGLFQSIRDPCFTPDDRFLAGGSQEGLYVWEAASGKRVAAQILKQATPSIEFVDARTLVSSGDAGVIIWTNAHPQEGFELVRLTSILAPGNDALQRASLSSDGTRLVGVNGNATELREFPSGRLRYRIEGPKSCSTSIFSADGQWIVSSFWDNTAGRGGGLWLWSAADGQVERTWPLGNGTPCFSPDGRWFVIGLESEYQQYAIQGSPAHWPLVRRYPRETSGFYMGNAAFSHDGFWLAMQADDSVIRLVEAATGQELARFASISSGSGLNSVGVQAFSHTDRWLVADSSAGLLMWDLVSLRARLRGMNLDWQPDTPLPDLSPAPVLMPVAHGKSSVAAQIPKPSPIDLPLDPSPLNLLSRDGDWAVYAYGAPAKIGLDSNLVHQGQSPWRIQAVEPADIATGCTLRLRPNSWYRFAGWVKTEQLKPQGALKYGTLMVLVSAGWPIIATGANHSGDTDWTRVTVNFQAPENGIVRPSLFFAGWGFATGTVWFNRLSLEEIDVAPLLREPPTPPPSKH